MNATGAVVFLCGGCDRQAAVLLCPRTIYACTHGNRFAPNVQIPTGWQAYTGADGYCWQCPSCADRHGDLLAEAAKSLAR